MEKRDKERNLLRSRDSNAKGEIAKHFWIKPTGASMSSKNPMKVKMLMAKLLIKTTLKKISAVATEKPKEKNPSLILERDHQWIDIHAWPMDQLQRPGRKQESSKSQKT